MSQSVKIEVSISLEDFFNSENERTLVFQEALREALLEKMRDNQWVQQNIAYYIYKGLLDEQFKADIETIKQHVHEHAVDFKMSGWDVINNDVVKKHIAELFQEMKPTFQDAARKASIELIESDEKYSTFKDRIADRMMDNVFECFVKAMVDKEMSK